MLHKQPQLLHEPLEEEYALAYHLIRSLSAASLCSAGASPRLTPDGAQNG
jgi:hypothetical protein